jgi:hypothetical protein
VATSPPETGIVAPWLQAVGAGQVVDRCAGDAAVDDNRLSSGVRDYVFLQGFNKERSSSLNYSHSVSIAAVDIGRVPV